MARQFNVIIDNREKYPWKFPSSQVGEVKFGTLTTGDYAIEGLEDKLCLERKMKTTELAGNVTTERFKNQLERMAEYEHKFLICEFSYEDIAMYPLGAEISDRVRARLKVKGPYLQKCLSQIEVKYGIHCLYCTNASFAAYAASQIMKRVVEQYEKD